MKTTKLLLCALLGGAMIHAARAASPVPPIVSNLVSVQRAGTYLVDITYDLIDPDSASVFVGMEYSTNGTTAYMSPRLDSVSGDVFLVTPGVGRHIVWNAWTDAANVYTTNARVRLTVDDTGSFQPPPTNVPPAPNLAWIQPGSFSMTSTTLVYISRGFWMGKYEVTQGDYIAIMTNNPSYFLGDTNRPVEQVSWNDAVLGIAH